MVTFYFSADTKPPKEMLKDGEKISFVMPIDYNIKDYLGKK